MAKPWSRWKWNLLSEAGNSTEKCDKFQEAVIRRPNGTEE